MKGTQLNLPKNLKVFRGRQTFTSSCSSTQTRGMEKMKQNFNAAGVNTFFQVLKGSHELAIPHVMVPDISHVDWNMLAKAGFQGAVFDKDNTLTKPFESTVAPVVQQSLQNARVAFGSRLVLFSNSAGLEQYDPQGAEADALEASLGIPVLRHKEKKPGGGCQDLEQHFGCPCHQLIMVGDRYLTDIVYGNRHGMLTIRAAPFTTDGEPLGVVMARKIEDFYVARWTGRGEQAPSHPLVLDKTYSRFIRPESSVQ